MLAAVPSFVVLALAAQGPADVSADFELSAGLALTTWAESPELFDPTSLDVDALGRVWVTEGVNYRLWNNPERDARAEGDRVVVLEDTDRDGRCDSARTYAEGPELVAPLGILVQNITRGNPQDSFGMRTFVGERVYVSCSPDVWVYQDRNGDGDALDEGEKERFLTGFGGRDHDHGVHALVPGRDGRLYFTVGNAGPHLVTDRGGKTLRAGSSYRDGGAEPADNKPGLVSDDGRVYVGGLVLSVARDGSDLRVEAHNLRNPYDVAIDGEGELYTFDNDDEVSACRALWVLRGGNHGFASADGSRTWRADRRPGQSIATAHWHADDPGVVPLGTITGAGGPTGVLWYDHPSPEPLAKHAFARLLCADAGRGEVLAFEPATEGAGVELVPRASLVRARGDAQSESARWFRPSDLAAAPDGTLFLADWYDPGVGGHGVGDAQARGRILRLAPPGHLPPDYAKQGAVDVRAGSRLDEGRELRARLLAARGGDLDELVALARELDVADRAYLELLGLACAGREEQVWARLAAEIGDAPAKWDERVAALAWRLHPPSAVPALAARAMDASLPVDARRRSLDALAFVRTREAAEAMANLAVASPEDLRAYARWWLEDRATNEWSGWVDLAALGGRLADAELAWSSGVVSEGEHEVSVDVRGAKRLWLVVAEGERGNGYDWADWLAPRFEDLVGGVTRLADLSWVEARAAWGETRVGASCAGGPLVVGGETRADGIGTHARSEIAYDVPEGAVRFRATAAPDDGGARQQGSTTELEFQVLVERGPSRDAFERLRAAAFGSGSADERLAALRELVLHPEGGLELVRAAERGTLDDAAKAAVAESIFSNPDLGVRARASAWFARPGERARPSIESLLALRGDAARGRELFLDPRAQCSTCHAFELGGRRRGGDVGPELTGVRTKLDAARLLDAILNPSAEIAHGYETWLLETRSGELVAGFVLADGETVVVKDTQGKRRAIRAEDVAERTRERVSTMPDGVAAGLTDQELADLVAFLRDDPEREPRFGPEIELWNGRDLDGWTFFLDAPGARREDVWSVRDGVLVCKGNPIGYLRTEASFTSFELTLEWRFDPEKGPGNSGVLLRQVGPDQVWPTSIEAQLQHGNAGDIWNIGRFPMAVDEARTSGRHTARARPSSERALGEWNRYRIRLDRGALELEVNGVVQNTASWCREVAGPICLQSEGAEIHFRSIRLRPIVN